MLDGAPVPGTSEGTKQAVVAYPCRVDPAVLQVLPGGPDPARALLGTWGARNPPGVFANKHKQSAVTGHFCVPQAPCLRGAEGGGGENVAPGVGAGHGRVGAAAGGRWGCADRLGSPHLPKCECFGLRLCVCAWCACPQNSRRGRRKRTRTQWECRGLVAFCPTPA